jgi:hypothetical protein
MFEITSESIYTNPKIFSQHAVRSNKIKIYIHLVFSYYSFGLLLLKELHMDLSDIVESILNAHDTTKVSLAITNLSFSKNTVYA